jgi:hypothetical protein
MINQFSDFWLISADRNRQGYFVGCAMQAVEMLIGVGT